MAAFPNKKKVEYFMALYVISVILSEKCHNFDLNQKIKKDTSESLHFSVFSNISWIKGKVPKYDLGRAIFMVWTFLFQSQCAGYNILYNDKID